jgi:L-ascorbate metabolism protein UlaG (beta-lactamase superfamily)
VSGALLTYIGHATVLIEMDGVRILTDPVLRNRVLHLRRMGPPIDPAWTERIDAVLLSHLHLDHADLPSLKRLGPQERLIVPRGSGEFFRRRGFEHAEELAVGEAVDLNGVSVRATPAQHPGRRPPLGPVADAIGFLIQGSRSVYFAGDTDLFPDMGATIRNRLTGTASLDVALIPVWGWGSSVGPGHLDPDKAAQAVRDLAPAVAIPIHWGDLRGIGSRSSTKLPQGWPPDQFAQRVAELAPDVDVQVMVPGETLELRGDPTD